MKFNKKDFIKEFEEKTGKENSKFYVEIFLDIINDAILNNDKVSLYNIGTFNIVDKPETTGRNLKTGELIKVLPKKGVKFKPSKTIIEKLNK